eukprot:CAMPEP_0198299674 /NCGR_PEP_ID=MMETSP1449-20131203/45590_1 /TAXON_ID=420275 /ORGANISM="Attheya septentrionalis, Strain CCMP2084" /LENGTH=169 /DNA_ID=CAMNT_0044001301 /DNA_START=209 /DNA_END=718 /DNA_ORIENTATION=-
MTKSSIPHPASLERMQPKPRPRRALSAYNLFFKGERQRFLISRGSNPEPRLAPDGKRRHGRTHGEIQFTELVRMIATKWRALDDDKKAPLIAQAAEEKRKQQIAVAAWKEEENNRIELEAIKNAEESNVFYCSRTVPIANATQISEIMADSPKVVLQYKLYGDISQSQA